MRHPCLAKFFRIIICMRITNHLLISFSPGGRGAHTYHTRCAWFYRNDSSFRQKNKTKTKGQKKDEKQRKRKKEAIHSKKIMMVLMAFFMGKKVQEATIEQYYCSKLAIKL